MNTKAIITQCKRELWEYKGGFIYTPLIVTGLTVLISLVAIIYLSEAINSSSGQRIESRIECNGNFCHDEEMQFFNAITSVASDPIALNKIALGAMYVNCVLLTIVFSIVLGTYVLRCLFDDRKSRDILFWRSMPVSETTNVLVKLSMQLLGVPLIILFISECVSLILVLAGLIIFSVQGVELTYLLASVANGQTLYIPLQIFYKNVFGLLMLMPLIGYLLFSSALAKKSPFFTSAIIPAILIFADILFNKFLGISLGIVELLGSYVNALSNVKGAFLLWHSLVFDQSMLLPFIVCVVVGSLFVGGAIWLRNNRYEI